MSIQLGAGRLILQNELIAAEREHSAALKSGILGMGSIYFGALFARRRLCELVHLDAGSGALSLSASESGATGQYCNINFISINVGSARNSSPSRLYSRPSFPARRVHP